MLLRREELSKRDVRLGTKKQQGGVLSPAPATWESPRCSDSVLTRCPRPSCVLCCLRVVAGVDAASRSRTALGLWSFGAVELWGCVVGLSKEGVTALGRGQGGTGVQGTVLPEGLAHSAPATPLVSTFPLPSLRSCRSPLPGALFPSLFTSSYFPPNGSPAV